MLRKIRSVLVASLSLLFVADLYASAITITTAETWAGAAMHDITPTGDFDGNDLIDGHDLKFLLERWLATCTSQQQFCQGRDINMDTIVDFKDFSILSLNWLNTGP